MFGIGNSKPQKPVGSGFLSMFWKPTRVRLKRITVVEPCVILKTFNRDRALRVAVAFRKAHPEARVKFIGDPDNPHYHGQYVVVRKDGKCGRKVILH